MRLLLDTNALLWLLAGDARLGAGARDTVEKALALHVSVASLWEIAIKVSLGKLAPLPSLPDVLAAAGVHRVGIENAHLTMVESLPWHHRDPFDRLLVAQALSEDLDVLSADGVLARYGVRLRDAKV